MSDPLPSQFSLFGQKNFYPLFWTQFGGAFNDNFYKSALLMLFTYSDIDRWGLNINLLNNLVAAALIVPFLLFAPSAGQIADRYDKAHFIRRLKLFEIVVMLLGAIALWLNSAALLLLVIFLTGTQSACFSPLKYGILPQHVSADELTGANGLLHTGTSLAIFLGMIAGTLALQFAGGQVVIAVGALLVAWAGWRISRVIPPAPPVATGLPIERNPFKQIVRVVGYARENTLVFWSIMGASWYWFLGSVYLTQLPNFTRETLAGAPAVVSFLLVLFLVGICLGALVCDRLSRRIIEPAVVPIGALVLLVMGTDLTFAGKAFAQWHAPASEGVLWSLSELLGMPRFWRVAFDVLVLGSAGGLYLVPLNALMQQRAAIDRRGQIIAANNVINALFMIAAAVFGIVFLGVLGLSIPHFFMLIVLCHIAMMALLFWAQPLFIQRVKERFFG
ncbi:MAG TPA: MFS transporter [Cellvibrionaceae bacterium]